MEKIILFDGDCSFCNRSFQFIIKRDLTGKFYFASLQSCIGLQLQQEYNIPSDENSLIVIDQDKFYSKSTAALQICKQLKLPWKMFYVSIIIPKPARDIFYNIIAKHRYDASIVSWTHLS